MKNTSILSALRASALAAVLITATSASAAFITNTVDLPPAGVYLSTDIHAKYAGPALEILLKRPEHAPIAAEVQKRTNNMDEIEDFPSTLTGTADITPQGQATIPNVPVNAFGPVQTVVRGKVGHTTGSFDTEMLQLNLSGITPLGPFMIRESPTKASTGKTTITDIGGGLYKIDSFFDVFTELSVDGGATWTPASTPVRVDLQPNRTYPPIPTVSQWGLIVLALLMLSIGTAFIMRQRPVAPATA